MAKRVSVDKWLFGVTLALVFIGLVMVFSASAVVAKERFGSPYHFMWKQTLWAFAGIAALFAAMNVDYKRFRHPVIVYISLAVTTVLLFSVFFLDRSHNTHRWIKLGALSFQPSELAKPAIILYLAYFLETRFKTIDEWRRTLLPAVVPTLLFAGLIAKQPDLGTAMACCFITGAVLWVAGLNWKWLGGLGAMFVVAAGAMVVFTPWRWARIIAFVNPESDPQGKGFHIIQSLIAVGTGGLTGRGLMEGKQKLFYLPEPQTDFIYAVIAEEWGLIGSIIIVLLFAFFCYRGIQCALSARDNFSRFMAVGITAMVGIQAFFNISVVLGLLPTKGIPLPFISYGGSSLFITLASVGVLLNITKQTD